MNQLRSVGLEAKCIANCLALSIEAVITSDAFMIAGICFAYIQKFIEDFLELTETKLFFQPCLKLIVRNCSLHFLEH